MRMIYIIKQNPTKKSFGQKIEKALCMIYLKTIQIHKHILIFASHVKAFVYLQKNPYKCFSSLLTNTFSIL